jgi:dihydroorotase
MRLIISGGVVIDPAHTLSGEKDVFIEEGLIRAVDRPGSFDSLVQNSRVIEAKGLLVTPGLIDMHVHLREPGYEYKETILTGTQAAAAGGFSAVACMANTDPINDSGAVTRYIQEQAQAGDLARVFPIGALSKGLKGEELAEIGEMAREGIVAVSDDGQPVMDTGLMRRALEYCRMFNLPVIIHAEDLHLSYGGVMNEGPVALRLGLKGIPNAAEEVMVARDIALAALTGGRLHIAHVSTRGTVALIRKARADGITVTAEAAPHHFTLTEEAVEGYNTNAKMSPPLRSAADLEAIKEGLRDGTIDAIATDHAPHHRDEKEIEFDRAANGVVGLETALSLTLGLVEEGGLPLLEAVRRLTVNPARILGLPYGTLSPGVAADVAIIDPKRKWQVVVSDLCSKSKNTPFAGREMKGRAVLTIVGGRIVYDDLGQRAHEI